MGVCIGYAKGKGVSFSRPRVHVTLIPASLPFVFGLFSIKNLAHRCKFKPFLYCLNPGDGKEMSKKRDARAKLLFC